MLIGLTNNFPNLYTDALHTIDIDISDGHLESNWLHGNWRSVPKQSLLVLDDRGPCELLFWAMGFVHVF